MDKSGGVMIMVLSLLVMNFVSYRLAMHLLRLRKDGVYREVLKEGL